MVICGIRLHLTEMHCYNCLKVTGAGKSWCFPRFLQRNCGRVRGCPYGNGAYAPTRGAKYYDEYRPKSVFLFVCRKLHSRTSPKFCICGVARFSSDGVVIGYILPVLWMTSRFLIRVWLLMYIPQRR